MSDHGGAGGGAAGGTSGGGGAGYSWRTGEFTDTTNVSTEPEGSNWGPPQFEKMPTRSPRGAFIAKDSLRMLVTTRRNRISEFAAGAFVGTLPGAIQTLVDWHDKPSQMPPLGHLIELLLAILFFGGILHSLAQFSEPTARDILEEIAPEAAKGIGFIARCGRLYRRAIDDFKNPE